MSRAKRTDANQTKIVSQLRQLGFSVAITSMVGDGFPDLVVAKANKTCLIELKDGSKPPSQRKLTPDEIKFIDEWRGAIIVATELKPILDYFGMIIINK